MFINCMYCKNCLNFSHTKHFLYVLSIVTAAMNVGWIITCNLISTCPKYETGQV